jgi:uncharacterized protein YneF (UPF0154 family)
MLSRETIPILIVVICIILAFFIGHSTANKETTTIIHQTPCLCPKAGDKFA